MTVYRHQLNGLRARMSKVEERQEKLEHDFYKAKGEKIVQEKIRQDNLFKHEKIFLIFFGDNSIGEIKATSAADALHKHIELITINTFVYSLRTVEDYRKALDIIGVCEQSEFMKLVNRARMGIT